MPYETRIPEIIAAFDVELVKVVTRAGLHVEAGAKQRARVDTGYMRRQIRWHYMETAVEFTDSKDEPVTFTSAPALSGEVVGGANYTIYNEYGTIHMAARPMFAPAVEETRPVFEKELIAAIKKVTE